MSHRAAHWTIGKDTFQIALRDFEFYIEAGINDANSAWRVGHEMMKRAPASPQEVAVMLGVIEAMPMLVLGPEHYAVAYHDLATVAAPIHDVRGRIAGIIAIAGPSKAGSSHTLALVMAAARAISNQPQTDW